MCVIKQLVTNDPLADDLPLAQEDEARVSLNLDMGLPGQQRWGWEPETTGVTTTRH